MKKNFVSALLSIVISTVISTVLATFLVTSSKLYALDIRVSLAELNNPGFVPFLEEMRIHYNEGSFSYREFPFPRSIANAVNNTYSFHMPMLENPLAANAELPYLYSSEAFGSVSFVIYSHKDNKLSKDAFDGIIYTVDKDLIASLPISNEHKTQLYSLQGDYDSWLKLSTALKHVLGDDLWLRVSKVVAAKLFPFTIATERNHTEFLDLPTIPSTNIESALKKVSSKRLDAVIFAQENSDNLIRAHKLDQLHRSYYRSFDAKFIIGKSENSRKIDDIISDLIKKIKSSGRFNELSEKMHSPYIEWQPHQSL